MPTRLPLLLRPFLLACLLAPLAAAQAAYPERPVRIVVPFAPGGGTDLIARTIGAAMSTDLGQPVVVDNKPGGGTMIGSEAVARSAPDGYTLLMATFAHAVNPSLQAKIPYDTDKAFAPVALLGRSPNVLVVRAESPWRSVAELLAAARAKPGTLTYASQGIGTSAHLAGELFKSLAKVDMVHVPYRGAGPAMNDLLGGQVDMMFATAAAAGTHMEGGKLRALAVTTADRSPAAALKAVPTLAESGVPGYAAESWYGIYAPAGTPANVVQALNAAARRAVASDAFVQRVAQEGLTPYQGAPADLARYVTAEQARWSKVVKEAGIAPE